MKEISFTEIKKLQKGDKKIFDRIMVCYKKMVVGLCFRYMRNIEEANDMAQEVFAQLYKSIDKFEFKSKFSTWIYRVAVNYCMNRLRALKRRGNIERAFSGFINDKASEAERIMDHKKLADEEVELQELHLIVEEEIAVFPEKERMLLILRDIKGEACKDIGIMFKMSAGNVKTTVTRIRKKLRRNVLKKLGEKR
jgi:RNA polymerase sigma-70 factor, ECF subfamily